MVRLCIFDLDGTLCDTYHDTMNSINHALGKFGIPPGPPSAYFEFLKKGNLIASLIGENKYSDELYEAVRKEYKAYHIQHLTDTTRPFPGIPELISELNRKGVICGVLTNKKDPFAKKMISNLFPAGSFRFVVGNSKKYPAKPEPISLHVLLSAYDVEKEECLLIGDSDVDVKTARNAGVKCVGVTWGYERAEMEAEGPELLAVSAEELRGIILGKECEICECVCCTD